MLIKNNLVIKIDIKINKINIDIIDIVKSGGYCVFSGTYRIKAYTSYQK